MSKLNPEEFLKKLADKLQHDRGDITTVIEDYLDDEHETIDDLFDERYVSAKIPGENKIDVEYDTFTGTLHYRKLSEEWNECEDYETRKDEVI